MRQQRILGLQKWMPRHSNGNNNNNNKNSNSNNKLCLVLQHQNLIPRASTTTAAAAAFATSSSRAHQQQLFTTTTTATHTTTPPTPSLKTNNATCCNNNYYTSTLLGKILSPQTLSKLSPHHRHHHHHHHQHQHHYSTLRTSDNLQHGNSSSIFSRDDNTRFLNNYNVTAGVSAVVPNRQYGIAVFEGGRRDVIMPDKTIRSPFPDLDIPDNMPFHQFIFDKCDEFGDRPALSDYLFGRTYTYKQLKERTIRLASALSRRGYKKGDIILAFSPNQIDYTVLMLACSCIGAWFCAANPTFTPEDLARQISLSDSVAVFTHPALAAVSDQALDCKDFPHKIKDKFVFGEASGYEPIQKLFEDDGQGFPDVSIDAKNDVFVLPYSSGTTGLPKGVMLTHNNLISNLLQLTTSFTYNVDENVLGLLPLYHIYGMVVIQGGALGCGAHLHFLPKFEPETFLACLQDRKIETANLVPPLAVFLAKHPLVSKYDLSHLKYAIVGAAPLGRELTCELVDRIQGLAVTQGFGMTETSPVTHIDIDCIFGSIGSLVSNTTAKFVDLETDENCGANQEGELCVRGPQVMLGYYKNEAATKEMITQDGWLHTGDIGYYDEDGISYISGRLKELIKYKGSQVAPAELESLLLGHPDIADVCVMGKPDERAGELPKAFVVKRPGSNLSEEDIVKYVDEQVSDFKRLRGGVEFIQEVPKNPSGKILRRLLK